MSTFVTLSNFLSRHAGIFISLTILLITLLGATVLFFTRVRECTVINDVEAQLQTIPPPEQVDYNQKIIDEKRLTVSLSDPTLSTTKESIPSFSSQPNIPILSAADDTLERSPITFPLLSTSWMEGSLSSSSIGESCFFDELVEGEERWDFSLSLVQAVAGVPPIVGVQKPLLHASEAERRVETECSIPPAKSMECVFVDNVSITKTTKTSIRSPRIKKEPTNECWWASPGTDKENRRNGMPSRSGMLSIAGLKRTPAKRQQQKNSATNRPPWGSSKGFQKTVALKSPSRGTLSMRN